MSDLYNTHYKEIFNNGSDVFATSFDWGIHFYQAPKIFSGQKDLTDDFLNTQLLLKTVGWATPDVPDVQPMVVNIHGHQFTQPGIAPNYGQVSFTYQDTANLNIMRYFNALEYAMDDPATHTTNGRSPSSFKFGFRIDKLDPMGNSIMRWNCFPCTLLAVNGDLNNGSSDKSIQGRIQVTFAVDYFKIYYPTSAGDYADESEKAF